MAYVKKKTIRKYRNKHKEKIKTKIKSSASKRFDVKPSGVITSGQANKRHRAMHHSNRQKMVQRRTTTVKAVLARFIKKILRIKN